jgi:subtilisin family serine protease
MRKLLLFILLITLFITGCTENTKIPNDPYFKYQISFLNPGGKIAIDQRSYKPTPKEIDAEKDIDLNIIQAWSISKGSKKTVIALLDDGFFYNHEDIKQNIWGNPGEIGMDSEGYSKETNGIDDDKNGYVDDVMGWDFVFDDPDPDCYIFDGMDATRVAPYWHSIPAMGIIGARGNNGIGVAGINWKVSLMLLKIGAQGIKRGEVDTKRNECAAKAIRYAADNGARVINWSGFVSDTDPERLALLKEAVDYAESKGVLLVVAAGNSAKDLDMEENFTFPACFENENILTVAELDFKGHLFRYKIEDRIFGSNFGVKNVDIGAIGENYTTGVRNGRSVYWLSGGTSNSAPVVSGVAGLLLSVDPGLRAPELKELLMSTARKLPALESEIKSQGMVDAYAALKKAADISN